MKSLERIIVVIGALDLAYIAWVLVGTLRGAGFSAIWQSTVAFGLPFPALQVGAVAAIYLAILACGLALLLRRRRLAWLNYWLLPLRVALVLPTLFPLFAAMSAIGIASNPWAVFALLAITELFRVVLVYRWSRAETPVRHAVGSAV
ncbi:hypothetical protein ACFQZQ_10210 [Lysobacter koreensis]|uniref:Integral membrane protein n=1 Tax=Lysobacter koreensis TaxID=266122 RepID=A0ABW2YNK7_9GAMM